MVYLTRKIEFSASHLYNNPAFSPEENRRVFGKCNNPGGHGHNYVLEVTVGGETDPQTGMVLDLVELKQVLESEIMQRMDHRFLNYEVAELAGKIPTCENVAMVIWQLLEPQINRKIGQGHLHRVRLWESPDLFADCFGDGEEKESADPPHHPDRMIRGMTRQGSGEQAAGRMDRESQDAASVSRAKPNAAAAAATGTSANGHRVSLTRRYSFAASHRLHSAQLDEAANQRVYGKCNNTYGHGHNYVVEVTVAGAPDPATGMIAHLTELDRFVEREVLDPFDHKYLNEDVPAFRERVPTTENLCMEIFERLKTFPGARLEKIRVEETGKNSFEYRG